MKIDEAFHIIDEAIRKKQINFLDFHDVGVDEDYEDYYYAEGELYVIHDRITDGLRLYHGKSPKEAYQKMTEDSKIMCWCDSEDEEE